MQERISRLLEKIRASKEPVTDAVIGSPSHESTTFPEPGGRKKRRSLILVVEDPCSLLQGIFDRKESGLFYDSLAFPAASGGECARFCGSSSSFGK
jgi:hypothetical protein